MDNITDVTSKIDEYVGYIAYVFLGACVMLVVLFAVWVGFRLAKAEDEKTRQDAKSQLIYSIVGILGIAVITTLIAWVIPALSSNVYLDNRDDLIPGAAQSLQAIGQVVNAILKIISTAAVMFAVYVGWNLMKADDDKKRQQAKMQLIYTIVAAIGIVLINAIAQMVFSALIGSKI